MNPLTNTRNITNLSKRELTGNAKTSWHDEYKDSAWVFTGGLPYDLSEGDVLAIFSQYGEIVQLNLCRDKVTGKQKGFAFICYEDQRSTVLAVDNFNGMKILGRTIRVDHVKDYKPPTDSDKLDDITRQLMSQGCAPAQALEEDFLMPLPPPTSSETYATNLLQIKNEPSWKDYGESSLKASKNREKYKEEKSKPKKSKKSKSRKKKSKHKKEKSSKRKKRRHSSSTNDDDIDSNSTSGSDSESSEDDNRKKRRKK